MSAAPPAKKAKVLKQACLFGAVGSSGATVVLRVATSSNAAAATAVTFACIGCALLFSRPSAKVNHEKTCLAAIAAKSAQLAAHCMNVNSAPSAEEHNTADSDAACGGLAALAAYGSIWLIPEMHGCHGFR